MEQRKQKDLIMLNPMITMTIIYKPCAKYLFTETFRFLFFSNYHM